MAPDRILQISEIMFHHPVLPGGESRYNASRQLALREPGRWQGAAVDCLVLQLSKLTPKHVSFIFYALKMPLGTANGLGPTRRSRKRFAGLQNSLATAS